MSSANLLTKPFVIYVTSPVLSLPSPVGIYQVLSLPLLLFYSIPQPIKSSTWCGFLTTYYTIFRDTCKRDPESFDSYTFLSFLQFVLHTFEFSHSLNYISLFWMKFHLPLCSQLAQPLYSGTFLLTVDILLISI